MYKRQAESITFTVENTAEIQKQEMKDDVTKVLIDVYKRQSVECVERGLDPFTTNLVVADPDRSVSTICLAITPAMKKLGIRNRCRIHEIPDHIEYRCV